MGEPTVGVLSSGRKCLGFQTPGHRAAILVGQKRAAGTESGVPGSCSSSCLQPGSQEVGLVFALTLGKDEPLYLLGPPPWAGANIVFRQKQQRVSYP